MTCSSSVEEVYDLGDTDHDGQGISIIHPILKSFFHPKSA